jgi:hypothetical protein
MLSRWCCTVRAETTSLSAMALFVRPVSTAFIGVLEPTVAYRRRPAQGPVAAQKLAGDGGVGTRYLITAKVGTATVRSP